MEIKPSINKDVSQQSILETLFSDSNLSRINQHKNKTLLPHLKAKTNEVYLQLPDNTHTICYRTFFPLTSHTETYTISVK